MLESDGNPTLAIYTVLVGEKEALNDALQLIGGGAASDLPIEFFCFTDRERIDSPTWKIRHFDPPLIPPEKASRLPKALPHLFFPDHQYSLYIDNTVVLKRLPNSGDTEGALLRGFRHPWRTNPLDEADIVVKSGLDDPDLVSQQVHCYAAKHPTAISRLTAGTVLLRNHHDPRVRFFGELWWQQILLFSKRDQLSLDICASEAQCPVEYFEGDQRNNDLFLWPVFAGNARRVFGSFDADMYAWLNRDDAAAVDNPRAHFLESAAGAERFDRHVPWFRYACLRSDSSLAMSIAPRRNITAAIEFMLEAVGSSIRSILIVGVQSPEVFGSEERELKTAAAAFDQYFRFAERPQVTTAQISQTEVNDSAPFQSAGGQRDFSRILVLGLAPQQHCSVLSKFLPLLAGEGQVLLQFGGSLTLNELRQMHSEIGYLGTLRVFHGGHISSKLAIPSSVVLLDLRISEPASVTAAAIASARSTPRSSRLGVEMSAQANLLAMLRLMTPVKSRYAKVRIGSLGDGGYVLPDDLAGISHMISIGIGSEVSFDLHFANLDIPILQYDPTVAGPPLPHPRFDFHRLAWGTNDDEQSVTLAGILTKNDLTRSNDIILKFDVEGAEWSCMAAVHPDTLKQFRIIACELHGLNNLHDPAFFEQVRNLLTLLTANHSTVHLHANNCCGISLVGGVPVPAVVELTLLRNERSDFVNSHESIPGPLDYPNMTDRPDLVLNPFGSLR